MLDHSPVGAAPQYRGDFSRCVPLPTFLAHSTFAKCQERTRAKCHQQPRSPLTPSLEPFSGVRSVVYVGTSILDGWTFVCVRSIEPSHSKIPYTRLSRRWISESDGPSPWLFQRKDDSISNGERYKPHDDARLINERAPAYLSIPAWFFSLYFRLFFFCYSLSPICFREVS